jgi:hypothetical protein
VNHEIYFNWGILRCYTSRDILSGFELDTDTNGLR